MKRWVWTWLTTAAALSGCGARWVTGNDEAAPAASDASTAREVAVTLDAATTRPDVAAADAGACLATGVRCRGRRPGCCIGFCDYQPYGYGPGVCVVPQPDGEACTEDRGCTSGRCGDEVCRASACVDTGAGCDRDDGCCAGFCTASSTSYAPGRCALAQPVGAACDGPRWCVSGQCNDGLCAP